MRYADIDRLKKNLGIAVREASIAPAERVADRDVICMAEIFLALQFIEKEANETLVANARKRQAEIAGILAMGYAQGDPELGIPQDTMKAMKYGGQSNPEGEGKKTETVYNGFRWFNVIRLFTVRLIRMINFAGVSTGRAILKNISQLAAIGGLSYGLEVIFDLALVFKATFAPVYDKGTYGERFVVALTKGNRPHRLANAAVWFGVNFACFFLTGGAAAILNIALFAFDVLNDAYKGYHEMTGYWQLVGLYKQKLAQLEKKPLDHREEIARYQLFVKQTEAKLAEVRKLGLYQVMVTLTVLAGMVLIFFPPAGLVASVGLFAVQMAGASLAMMGSVFGGLGRKLYTTVMESRAEAATRQTVSKGAGQADVSVTVRQAKAFSVVRHADASLRRPGNEAKTDSPWAEKKREGSPVTFFSRLRLRPSGFDLNRIVEDVPLAQGNDVLPASAGGRRGRNGQRLFDVSPAVSLQASSGVGPASSAVPSLSA